MRLWHYELLPVLPRKQLISQWRECIAIKRQWEKGSLIHPLVSYVKKYNKKVFFSYVKLVFQELIKRGYKPQKLLLDEIEEWSKSDNLKSEKTYLEHDAMYLMICYYNLLEKYIRGIIEHDDYQKIITMLKYKLDNIDERYIREVERGSL